MKPIYETAVIMPCFNSIKTIDKSINSVLNQTYKGFHLFVVDDFSTDGTLEYIKNRYSNCTEITILTNKFIKGVSGARNTGLDLIGDARYVSFLDSDDVWCDTKLASQISFMKKFNIHLSYSNYAIFSTDPSINSRQLFFKNKISYSDLIKSCSMGCLTVCYDVKELGKFKFEYHPKEDYICWLRILKRIPYAYNVGESLAFYRKSNSSLSSNKLKEAFKQFFVVRNIEGNNSIISLFYLIPYIINGLLKR